MFGVTRKRSAFEAGAKLSRNAEKLNELRVTVRSNDVRSKMCDRLPECWDSVQQSSLAERRDMWTSILRKAELYQHEAKRVWAEPKVS